MEDPSATLEGVPSFLISRKISSEAGEVGTRREVGGSGVEAAVAGAGGAKSISPARVFGVSRKHDWR